MNNLKNKMTELEEIKTLLEQIKDRILVFEEILKHRNTKDFVEGELISYKVRHDKTADLIKLMEKDTK